METSGDAAKCRLFSQDITFRISRPAFIRVPIPLSPKSDQHEISPYNINALGNIVVMRNEYKISEDKSISLIDNSINSPHYFY